MTRDFSERLALRATRSSLAIGFQERNQHGPKRKFAMLRSFRKIAQISDTKMQIGAWQREYNESRPRAAVGYLTPTEYAAGAVTSVG
jgi:transposase InsO family protein